jgi:hypothetical protein
MTIIIKQIIIFIALMIITIMKDIIVTHIRTIQIAVKPIELRAWSNLPACMEQR